MYYVMQEHDRIIVIGDTDIRTCPIYRVAIENKRYKNKVDKSNTKYRGHFYLHVHILALYII